MLRQVATAGAPALWVDDGTRLPVVPYEPLSAGVAQLAAGLGRRYPTAQQRSAAAAGQLGLRVVPEPRPEPRAAAEPRLDPAAPALPAQHRPQPGAGAPSPAPTPGAP